MIHEKQIEIIILLVVLLVVLASLRIRTIYRALSGILILCLVVFGGLLYIADRETRELLFKCNYTDASLSGHMWPLDNMDMVNDGCCSYPGIYEGDTLLIMASRHGNRENVRFLLSRGANRNLRNKQGDTALDVARRYGHPEICRMLEAP